MSSPGPGPADRKPITMEDFKEWNKSCRVRAVQGRFEEILAVAKQKGITVEEEMKSQGYDGYDNFAKSCDQFPVMCWPEAFAELGSGFVLYFYFLAFLGFLLCLAFVLQTPALAAYADEDYLGGWKYHEWADGMPWASNDDNCKCASKGGQHPTGLSVGYGERCGRWDVDWCKSGSVSKPGKWCCVQWCFADEHCSTADVSPAYEQNMLYQGMVRATTTCATTSEMLSKANCPWSDDSAPSEKVFKKVTGSDYIGKGYLTPGNFGPDQADNSIIPFMYFLIVACLGFFITVMYQLQIRMDAKVDAGSTSPNDFAILVKGLPTTATDDQIILQFFQEASVKGKTDTEIVKVIIGWDNEEYRNKITEIRELRKKSLELDPADPKATELKKKIADLNAQLMSGAPDRASRLKSSGVVVIVFRYQADLRACLERWTSFWARWFYCDGEPLCGIPNICKGAPLRRFPMGDRDVKRITVERAPNPGDIHWEELGKDTSETYQLAAKTNGVMFIVVLFTALCTWGLNKAQEAAAEKEEDAKGDSSSLYAIVGFVPAFGVAVCNMIVMVSARRLGDKEYHETWTAQEFSQAVKMAVALLINTGGVLLWTNLRPHEWYKKGGLIDDALMILLLDALIPPFFFSLDFKYQVRRFFMGRHLTQAKIDDWNSKIETAKTLSPAERAKAYVEVDREVAGFKTLFEPSELDNPRRYANALNTFLCCLWLSPVWPFTCLIGIVGIVVQYWTDKYLLLRWCRRPKRPYNAFLAQFSLRMVKLTAPLGLTICFLFFLSPSWEDRQQVLQPFLLALIVSGGLIILPSRVLRTILGVRLFCGASSGYEEADDDSTSDYYNAQYLWSKEMKYHKDHFLYKCLPNSVNPEFLTKGQDTAVKLEAFKGAYGAATEKAASAAEAEPSGVALKGGRRVGGESADADGTPKGSGYGATPAAGGSAAPTYGAGGAPAAYGAGGAYGAAPASAPAPATYGAPASAPPPEPVAPPAAATAPAPHPPGGAPTPHRPAPKKPVWEFENNHGGFNPFGDDCQDYIEKKYQEYYAGTGQARANVRTGGKKLSVDFERMTQMVEGSHKVRKIRRTEA